MKVRKVCSVRGGGGSAPGDPLDPALTFIHNVILYIDTSDNASYNQFHSLIGMPYLSVIASNVSTGSFAKSALQRPTVNHVRKS